jgi:hypothetical protein
MHLMAKEKAGITRLFISQNIVTDEITSSPRLQNVSSPEYGSPFR